MARPQKQRCICSIPRVTGFSPQGCEASGSINLTYDEYEVIRLLDYMQMTQEQCAYRMGISRPTVTRIYEEARRKIADMLVNGRALSIGGGVRSVQMKRTAATGTRICSEGPGKCRLQYRGKEKTKRGKER